MKAIQLEQYGGPEVLQLVKIDKPVVGDRDVLVEIKAIGVNYADVARREGKYVVPTPLPFIPGAEVAGIITEVGKGVKRFKPGMRVVSLIESAGYSEYAAIPEMTLAPIPDGVEYTDAVALPLQGQTAYHILKTMGRLQKGETVLVHAAAGGVGAIAVQLAKLFGAGKVIATASSEEKLAHAKEMGADHLVNYTEEGWESKVRELTDGKGVDVALEMVGGDVFRKTLKCLAPFGRMVVFGAASGERSPMDAGELMQRNQSVVGFFLPQIMKNYEVYQNSFKELLEYVQNGDLQLTIGGTFDLEEAAEAQRQLQGRKTMGKLVLTT
ncbi:MULTISPECIES: quinone oxidoreductase [unclassified Sporosarcina]|uniref:quinone oxidoreductase family protein n=1 Tax=unclassified Sporosarcina TaxID=2647733 RepID=UPI000C1678BE|nr:MULTISPECIES: quinone oxidoreductase [unclassified Sporosarcina]PID00655.1 alcohol dehydrogenase [Sporosarcina sp. P29]PID07288.1 alcohol dehydrogenase [Sporosarcina sp. P30]PID10484.1 alcohol dehydrogenase [Sporosarcina sp. P31]PID13069.1 alcohol dehydrogenase [Sporosarcina sp. P32b]